MSAIDRVLACMPDARPSGPGRWRTWCRICGGNDTALSIGVGKNGGVLMRCFKSECSIEAIVAALGLSVSDLFPDSTAGTAPMRRRGLLSATQAQNLLHDEAQLIALAGSNIAHGIELSDTDRDRVLQAAGRVAYLRDEVQS